jgi:hypothetical protein
MQRKTNKIKSRTLKVLVYRHIFSETNAKKIEKIGFDYQDYDASYENLLIKAKMPTQHTRGIRTMAPKNFDMLCMYRIYHSKQK